ncbi:16S rRNA (cytosine(1402)-N(4))-methyltransferase [Ammoniphilus oxalaticus]|uniref:16S rRNA (Cytosine(1402)-N(4))-methyltransferase n=1 Tax=Ammoniphilus oxalaticus TaxID=66863 RepID=A0A419SJU3_9BACL|nr:class I SAM-dependent methyltransferase [Ammoniphilus oxalaticus]RKD24304.1 16S rRNA (cytosine(1402)-N(4))-methyltransferase [Ammoniphilus oxalaticus]
MFPRITDYAHQLLEQRIQPGAHVIDATMGNGHDTVFLAQQVGETGKVYSFDIQQQALDSTRQLLVKRHLEQRARLFLQSHAMMDFPAESIDAVVFNLGYLPRSDKTITTQAETTIESIKRALRFLKVGGLIVVVVYWGHEQGKIEKQAVEQFVEGLPFPEFMVLRYQYMNPLNQPPFVLAIERRRRPTVD